MIRLITSFILLATGSAQLAMPNSTSSPSKHASREIKNCNTIITVLEDSGFTSLLELVIKADLASTLVAPGRLTVFAPSNKAFDAINPETLQMIVKDPDMLKDILTYHILPFAVSLPELSLIVSEYYFPTVQGLIPIRGNQYQRRSASTLTINGAQIVDSLETCNGFVYPIDKVLNPRDLTGDNTEIQVLRNNGFTTVLKIYDIIGFTQNLNIFFRPQTFFAPTDAAFDALPTGLLDFLLANPEELLRVMDNHFVLGTFYSRGLVTGPLRVLSQAIIKVNVNPGKINFGSANVILPDLTNTQGVIHGIDVVILDQWEPPTTWRQRDNSTNQLI